MKLQCTADTLFLPRSLSLSLSLVYSEPYFKATLRAATIYLPDKMHAPIQQHIEIQIVYAQVFNALR